MEKITVVVPVYNTEKYVIKCLESIKNQTYFNLEVLIINDGSTDNSEKIIKNYLKDINDPRFIYHYKPNSGVGKTRNLGIKLATSNYISFIDSDDWIEKTFYEKLIKKIKKQDSFIMNSSFYKVYNTKKEITKIKKRSISVLKSPSCCLKLFNLTTIRQNNIQFGNYKMGEDLNFTFKVMCHNKNFSIYTKPLYNYYMRDDSTTHTYDISMFSLLDSISDMESYTKENNITKFNDILEYINISHILIALMKRVQHLKDFKTKVYEQLIDYVTNKYPNWINNKHIKSQLTKEEKNYLLSLYNKDINKSLIYLEKFL